MRIWGRSTINGITLYEYGDITVSPRHVDGKKRWFITEHGKNLNRSSYSHQNGYAKLKDAKAAANEILDTRNAEFLRKQGQGAV